VLNGLVSMPTILHVCRYQLDHGIESSPGRYDEETHRSLASSLENLNGQPSLSRVGICPRSPQFGAAVGLPRSPRMFHSSSSAATSMEEDDGVLAQAMVRRAWAELGVAVGPTGRPLGTGRPPSSPTSAADGVDEGLSEEAAPGLQREQSHGVGGDGAAGLRW
jgi:hypothetical protein